jgi:hypothetical protein
MKDARRIRWDDQNLKRLDAPGTVAQRDNFLVRVVEVPAPTRSACDGAGSRVEPIVIVGQTLQQTTPLVRQGVTAVPASQRRGSPPRTETPERTALRCYLPAFAALSFRT